MLGLGIFIGLIIGSILGVSLHCLVIISSKNINKGSGTEI